MPSLITKWKKGRPSLYWVRSAWRNGHSRLVEQRYRGPRDRVIEQIRAQFTSSPHPEALPPLHTVQTREFGAAAWFYSLAQALGLIELIDAHVPPAPPRRRPSLSGGHSLVLAALNRVAWPKSKRACAEWYQDTVLARLVPASRDALSRQRFWDHMTLFAPEPFAPLQRELLRRIQPRFFLGEQVLVYDTTNSSTFMHTFHRRPSRPQRGKNTQQRTDLRQLALALGGDEERGLPLYYRGYEGPVTAVVALSTSLQERRGHFLPQSASARLTLILDQGTVSRDHFQALQHAHFSFLAAIPAGWVRPLSQGSLQEYQPLPRPDGRRSKVYGQPHKRLGGILGPLLVSFSPRFYRSQVRTLDLLQRKAHQQLLQRHAALQQAVEPKRPRTEQAGRQEVTQVGRLDRLKAFFALTLRVDQGKVQELRWPWDRRKKRQMKHHDLGKTLLFTDRQELAPRRMVIAYRRQAKVEEMCRISKRRRPGWWWPAYHWTESPLSVHALYGFVALLLIRIVVLRLHERNLAIGVELLTERLRGIQEALVIYANGAAQRVITARSPEQEERFLALHLRPLAEQLGNRGLNP
jgi:transposase